MSLENLVIAIEGNDLPLLRRLLDETDWDLDRIIGSNFHRRTNWTNCTLLTFACCRRNREAARMLLERGASVSQADSYNWTPLHTSCYNGDDEIVEILLERNADISVEDGQGFKPFDYACIRGHEVIVRRFLSDQRVLASDNAKAFFFAIRRGHEEVVRVLLDSCGPLASRTSEWTEFRGYYGLESALETACRVGNQQITQLLLERGAIRDNDVDWRRPFIAACIFGREGIIELFLRYGVRAAPFLRDVSDINSIFHPLVDASRSGRIAAVQWLAGQRSGHVCE